jgi:hypothetical protein
VVSGRCSVWVETNITKTEGCRSRLRLTCADCSIQDIVASLFRGLKRSKHSSITVCNEKLSMCRPEGITLQSQEAIFGVAALEDAIELVGNHRAALVGMNQEAPRGGESQAVLLPTLYTVSAHSCLLSAENACTRLSNNSCTLLATDTCGMLAKYSYLLSARTALVGVTRTAPRGGESQIF